MTYALCSFDAAHTQHHNKLSAYERIADLRHNWTLDKKFSLLCRADDRHALMLNLLERFSEDEMANLILSLIQPDKGPRFQAVEETRRRLSIEAGKVAESEAQVMQDRGYFGEA